MTDKINLSPQKQKLIICIVLVLATLAVYWQVHQFDFVNFDDPIYVVENQHIQSGLSTEGIVWAFTTKYFYFWNPLLWISYMLDYQIFGLSAGGFHLTNLILHVLSTLLLFRLFNRMTARVWPSAFVAALFALHPLHVESVAWIAERKDVLSAFFWSLTLCLYVYYTEKQTTWRYLFVALSFICALMSKPMAVTLPLIMILLDYWPLDRLQTQNKLKTANEDIRPIKKKTKAARVTTTSKTHSGADQKFPGRRIAGIIPLWQIYEKSPFLILSTLLTVITMLPSSESTLQGISQALPLGQRLAAAPVYFVGYLAKTFWPRNLAVFYPSSDFPAWQVLGAVVLIIGISALVVLTVKRMPYLFVGWLWYCISILPVLGIVHITYGTAYSMSDRYHYLPSIGLAIMLAWGIASFTKRENLRYKILLPAGAVVIGVWAVMTWQQCQYWRNSLALFDHAIKVTNNNYLAHNNLAVILFRQGAISGAMEHHNEAIRIKSDYAEAYYNRGTTSVSLGRYSQALVDFDRAIHLYHGYVDAYNNRGSVYMTLGREKQAIEDFNTVIRLQDDYANAYYNRGIIYLNQGNKETGCLDAQKACSLGDCRLLGVAQSKGLCF